MRNGTKQKKGTRRDTMAKKQEKEIERWVTVNGARVPIFKDGSVGGPKALRDKVKAVQKKKDQKQVDEVNKSIAKARKEADTYQKKQKAKDKAEHKKNMQEKKAREEWEAEFGEEPRKLVSTSNVTSAKTHKDLTDKLKSHGLELESADAHTMRNSNSLNGEKVTMYDKEGNEYQGTYNKYSDGGREIVNIKKTKESPKKVANDNEDLKEKQIARNQAEKDERNGKAEAYKKLSKEEKAKTEKYVEDNKWVNKQVNDQIKSGKNYNEVMADVHEAMNSKSKSETKSFKVDLPGGGTKEIKDA